MTETLDMPDTLQSQIDDEMFKIEMVKIHNDYVAMRIFGETGNHPKAMENLRVSNFKKVR